MSTLTSSCQVVRPWSSCEACLTRSQTSARNDVSIFKSLLTLSLESEFQQQAHPIIIVPTTLQPGSLCLGNVQKFLKDGVYVVDKQDRDQPVQITRKLGGREITFDVYDSVNGFSQSKWRRVVAVFCSGQDWQFKDWMPMRGSGSELNKKELFARVRGYFMTYSDLKVPQNVENWNVFRMNLPRNKRHHDVNE